MTGLRNPRHERFARELAKGSSAASAYEAAGYRYHRSNAAKLARDQRISARVTELQFETAEMEAQATAKATAALAITKEWLIARTEEARALAMADNQTSAAVAAIKELGILSGLRIERRENLNRSIDDLSDEELMEIATGSRSDLH